MSNNLLNQQDSLSSAGRHSETPAACSNLSFASPAVFFFPPPSIQQAGKIRAGVKKGYVGCLNAKLIRFKSFPPCSIKLARNSLQRSPVVRDPCHPRLTAPPLINVCPTEDPTAAWRAPRRPGCRDYSLSPLIKHRHKQDLFSLTLIALIIRLARWHNTRKIPLAL